MSNWTFGPETAGKVITSFDATQCPLPWSFSIVMAQALPVTATAGVPVLPAYVPFPELAPDITKRWANAALLDLTRTVHDPCMLIAMASSLGAALPASSTAARARHSERADSDPGTGPLSDVDTPPAP